MNFDLDVEMNGLIGEELLEYMDELVFAAAEAVEQTLKRQLRAGARSGEYYSGQPRRSSAPGEFPQEQEGEFISSVAVDQVEEGEYLVGFFEDAPGRLRHTPDFIGKVRQLEFAPSSKGGRQPLARVMGNSQTIEAVDDAVFGALRDA